MIIVVVLLHSNDCYDKTTLNPLIMGIGGNKKIHGHTLHCDSLEIKIR